MAEDIKYEIGKILTKLNDLERIVKEIERKVGKIDDFGYTLDAIKSQLGEIEAKLNK